MRRKHLSTTQETALMDLADIENNKKLESISYKASKDEKKAHMNKHLFSSNLPFDDVRSRLDKVDDQIRAKLDRIGVNARLTPNDLMQMQTLSSPQQAEIDAYNLKLIKAGKQSGALAVAKPTLEPIPKTEDEWDAEGLGIANVETEIINHNRIIATASNNVQQLRNEQRTANRALRIRLGHQITQREQEITQSQAQLEHLKQAREQTIQARREYVQQIKERNKKIMKDYTEQIAPLTYLGLNLARLPNESDEDYQNRILIGAQALTESQQIDNGRLYIVQQFIEKLRSLNIPTVTVDSLSSGIPLEVQEYIITIWPQFKSEFEKRFGSNPYRLESNYEYIKDFIQKLFHERKSTQDQFATEFNNFIQQQQQLQNPENNNNPILNTSTVDLEEEPLKSETITKTPVKPITPEQTRKIKTVLDLTLELHELEKKISKNHDINMGKDSFTITSKKTGKRNLNYEERLVALYKEFELAKDVPSEEIEPERKEEEGKGFRQLGSKKIHIGQLLQANKLDLRHKSSSNVAQFPVTTISDHMTSLVNKLVNEASLRKKPTF